MSAATAIKARITPPKLSDTRLYVCLPGVAILDVHCRNAVDESGNSIESYCGEEQLAVLAKNSQARADRGDYGLVRVGHIDVKLPNHRERDQPEIIGYIPRYYMGSKDDGAVILADIYIEKDHTDDIRKFPRRSPEIFGKTNPDGFIDALALLNRPPERDLGLVTFAKELNPSPGTRTMLDQNDVKMICDGVVQAMGQFFESQAHDDTPGEPPHPELGGETPEADEGAPEEDAAGGGMGDAMGGMGADAGAFPGATSTSTPGMEEKPKEHEHMQSGRLVQEIMSMRGQFELFKKQVLETSNQTAGRIKTLESDLASKNLELRKERRTSVLTDLKNAGYRLNVKKELELCMKQSDIEFMDNVTRIRENYSRDISNHPFVPVDNVVATDEENSIPKDRLTPVEKRLGIKPLELYHKANPTIKRDQLQARYLDDIEYREKVIANARKTG